MARGRGLAVLAVLGLAAAATTRSRRASASPGYDPPEGPPPPGKGGWRELDVVLDAAGAHPEVKIFLTAIARRESNFHLSARNKRTSEVDAGRRGYENALKRGFFKGNTHGREFRTMGSAGWFGFLGSTGLAAGGTKGPFRLSNPYIVQLGPESVVMAYDFMHRNMRHEAFKRDPTWRNLNRAWAGLGVLFNPTSARAKLTDQRFDRNLERINHPTSFGERRVKGLSDYPGPVALLDRINRNLRTA